MADCHHWGRKSHAHLASVDPRFKELCDCALAVAPFDLAVTCGLRDKVTQDEAYRAGRSELRWPHGRHNALVGQLACAVDLHPYPIDWTDTRRYYYLAGIMYVLARSASIKLRWGGDWDRDGSFADQTFNDLPHFELLD